MDQKKSLMMIDLQAQEALRGLSGRQRKFVMAMADGEMTQTQAARQAGYTGTSAGYLAMKNPRVAHALELISRQDQLRHGISASWKRKKLVNLIEATSDPEAETFFLS